MYLPQLSLCHPCAREETLSLVALSWTSAPNLLSLELLPTEEEDARARAGGPERPPTPVVPKHGHSSELLWVPEQNTDSGVVLQVQTQTL